MVLFSRAISGQVRKLKQREKVRVGTLAVESGMSRPAFYDMLNGRSLPREHRLEGIFRALRLSGDEARRFHGLYEDEKLLGHRGKQREARTARAKFRERVYRKLLESGQCPWVSREADLDFFLEVDKVRAGVVAIARILDWEKALGSALGHMHTHNLDCCILCVTEAPANESKFLKLYKRYNIEVVPFDTLGEWKPG